MSTLIKIFGQLLFIAGCAGLWHFWSLNTSVYVPGRLEFIGSTPLYIEGRHVENIGRLNNRSSGLILSGLGVLVGTLFMLLPRDAPRE